MVEPHYTHIHNQQFQNSCWLIQGNEEEIIYWFDQFSTTRLEHISWLTPTVADNNGKEIFIKSRHKLVYNYYMRQYKPHYCPSDYTWTTFRVICLPDLSWLTQTAPNYSL